MKKLYFILFCLFYQCGLAQFYLKDYTHEFLPQCVKLPFNSMDSEIVDIDGDGDLDIIVAVEFYKNVILLNDGTGKFSDGSKLLPNIQAQTSPKPYPYYPYHDSEDIAVVDINQDGRLDLIFVSEDDKTNEYYIQQIDGTFADHSDLFPSKGISNAVAHGDFNEDGWPDIVIGNIGQNKLLLNNSGKLQDYSNSNMPAIEDHTQDIEVIDIDMDGDLDILVGNEDNNRLLINDGNAVFKDMTDVTMSKGISEETREAKAADVDKDGDLDIYFANVKMKTAKSPTQRLLLNTNGTYTDESKAKLNIHKSAGVIDAKFHDIDSDDDLDLILGEVTGLSIAVNDGNANFNLHKEPVTLNPITSAIVDIEVADFNKDGLSDIYLSCYGSSDILLIGSSKEMAFKPYHIYTSVDEVIDSLYSLLSGPAGKRDWTAFRLLFHPAATMGSVTSNPNTNLSKYYSFTPEQYISNNDAFLQKSDFYEEEIDRKAMLLDGVAQVASKYQYKLSKEGEIKEKGTNCFQLTKENGRWWITNLIWQADQ